MSPAGYGVTEFGDASVSRHGECSFFTCIPTFSIHSAFIAAATDLRTPQSVSTIMHAHHASSAPCDWKECHSVARTPPPSAAHRAGDGARGGQVAESSSAVCSCATCGALSRRTLTCSTDPLPLQTPYLHHSCPHPAPLGRHNGIAGVGGAGGDVEELPRSVSPLRCLPRWRLHLSHPRAYSWLGGGRGGYITALSSERASQTQPQDLQR